MQWIWFLIFVGLLYWWIRSYRTKRMQHSTHEFEEYFVDHWGEGKYPALEEHYTFREVCEAYDRFLQTQRKYVDPKNFLDSLEKEISTSLAKK